MVCCCVRVFYTYDVHHLDTGILALPLFYTYDVHHLDTGILALPLFRFPLFFFFLFVVLFWDEKLNLKSAKSNKLSYLL